MSSGCPQGGGRSPNLTQGKSCVESEPCYENPPVECPFRCASETTSRPPSIRRFSPANYLEDGIVKRIRFDKKTLTTLLTVETSLKHAQEIAGVRVQQASVTKASNEASFSYMPDDAIVCRCEMVTEGEILAELRSPVPARSYDAIKRRTWLGTGRCLGSFDMPRVVDIMVKELGLSPFEVTKKGTDSEFLIRPTKKVEC